jgi:hypothetical protein
MRRVHADEILLFLTSAVLLASTRVALSVFPFQAVLQAFGPSAAALPRELPLKPDALARVGLAVDRASRRVPGTRHCLTKALVAKLLLARRGWTTQIRIGVAKDQAGLLTAHAWLEADGEPIFGVTDAGFQEFALLPHLDQA